MMSQRACEECSAERLFFAEGVRDGEEEGVERRLGLEVFLPPPLTEREGDVEAQVVTGGEDGRGGERRCGFLRFCDRVMDGLGSRETRVTLVVGIVIFALFGLMVYRVISLERMCPHGTGETIGTSGADFCE